ncbi:hypothetical protein U1Q18_002269 [Sarracenia purpurea var. burkii]
MQSPCTNPTGRRKNAPVRHVERRGGARDVNPRRRLHRCRCGNHDRSCRSEEVRRRSEGGDNRVSHVNGGAPAGLQLGSLQLLPLLLVGVLVAAQRLGVGEFAAAVLALVLPAVRRRKSAGVGRHGWGLV